MLIKTMGHMKGATHSLGNLNMVKGVPIDER